MIHVTMQFVDMPTAQYLHLNIFSFFFLFKVSILSNSKTVPIEVCKKLKYEIHMLTVACKDYDLFKLVGIEEEE